MGVNPVFEVPWERKGVIAPGLPILPHGTERHPVPGGGSRAVTNFGSISRFTLFSFVRDLIDATKSRYRRLWEGFAAIWHRVLGVLLGSSMKDVKKGAKTEQFEQCLTWENERTGVHPACKQLGLARLSVRDG